MKSHTNTTLVFALIWFTLSWQPTQSQTSLEELYAAPGSYAVGFQHYGVVDSSRTYSRLSDWTNEKLPRPIPVSVWYPAEKNYSTNTLKILDYMRILKNEEEWEYLPD